MARNSTPAQVDWSTLGKPIASPSKSQAGSPTGNVIEKTPLQIRQRAEDSLAINAKRVAEHANSTASRNRVPYHFDCQPVSSAQMGEEFAKLLTKYAKGRPAEGDIPFKADHSPFGQVTARCGQVGYFRIDEDGNSLACEQSADGAFLGIRYSVRPFEHRKDIVALPGTTT